MSRRFDSYTRNLNALATALFSRRKERMGRKEPKGHIIYLVSLLRNAAPATPEREAGSAAIFVFTVRHTLAAQLQLKRAEVGHVWFLVKK